MNIENMLNHSYAKKFWEVSVLTTPYGRDDLLFFVPLILGGKLGVCERDDLFSALHLILGRKLDICGRDLQRTCPPFAQ